MKLLLATILVLGSSVAMATAPETCLQKSTSDRFESKKKDYAFLMNNAPAGKVQPKAPVKTKGIGEKRG